MYLFVSYCVSAHKQNSAFHCDLESPLLRVAFVAFFMIFICKSQCYNCTVNQVLLIFLPGIWIIWDQFTKIDQILRNIFQSVLELDLFTLCTWHKHIYADDNQNIFCTLLMQIHCIWIIGILIWIKFIWADVICNALLCINIKFKEPCGDAYFWFDVFKMEWSVDSSV